MRYVVGALVALWIITLCAVIAYGEQLESEMKHGFIGVIALMAACTGCTGGFVSEAGIAHAQKACESNGGLRAIGSSLVDSESDGYVARCNNGVVIENFGRVQ